VGAGLGLIAAGLVVTLLAVGGSEPGSKQREVAAVPHPTSEQDVVGFIGERIRSGPTGNEEQAPDDEPEAPPTEEPAPTPTEESASESSPVPEETTTP
jgi:hypothetical protein